MTESAKMRLERIARLMAELEYEIVRGVMEREIEPDIHMTKQFPCANRGDGTAWLELHVSSGVPNYRQSMMAPQLPRLRVVSPDGDY